MITSDQFTAARDLLARWQTFGSRVMSVSLFQHCSGLVARPAANYFTGDELYPFACERCRGTGQAMERDCLVCGGLGIKRP